MLIEWDDRFLSSLICHLFGLVFLHRIPVCSMIVGFSYAILWARNLYGSCPHSNICIFYWKQAFEIIHRYSITLQPCSLWGWKWITNIFKTVPHIYSSYILFYIFNIFKQPEGWFNFAQCYCNLFLNFRLKWSSRPLYNQWKDKCFQRTICYTFLNTDCQTRGSAVFRFSWLRLGN